MSEPTSGTCSDDIERETLVDALNKWGEDAQIEQTVEECAELIQAVYSGDREDVIDELADVRIMVAQISLLVGEDDVDQRVEYKMNRLKDRIGRTQGTGTEQRDK